MFIKIEKEDNYKIVKEMITKEASEKNKKKLQELLLDIRSKIFAMINFENDFSRERGNSFTESELNTLQEMINDRKIFQEKLEKMESLMKLI